MHQKVDIPVAVFYKGSPKDNTFRPGKLQWDGREYKVQQFGLQHTYRVGKTLCYAFSFDACSEDGAVLSFRIVFNTDTLQTRLEMITDGEVD